MDTIHIVDRGRGPQLSTSRITVLDLVHYFQRQASYEEISAVERYYLEHKEEFDQRERRAHEYREEQVRQQRLRFPELNGTREEQLVRLKQLVEKRRQEKNGEGHPG